MTRSRRWRGVLARRWVWAAGAAGVALAAVAAHELPYVNWQPVAIPVEVDTLVVRHDAKGSGDFGAPRSGNRRHRGIDLQAPLETPVRAIRSGRVIEAGTHKGLGRYVVIQHRNDLRSLYAHLHEIEIEEGARVRQGQLIGRVGKTGNARHRWIEPHVHLEVVKSGEAVDPALIGLPVPPGDALASETEAPDASGGD